MYFGKICVSPQAPERLTTWGFQRLSSWIRETSISGLILCFVLASIRCDICLHAKSALGIFIAIIAAQSTCALTISAPASMALRNHHKSSLTLYEDMILAGVCREQARGVLPQNSYTEYYGTVNLNNILKFIDLRLDSHAQWEIQRVAAACLEIATDLWPVTVGAYRDIRND